MDFLQILWLAEKAAVPATAPDAGSCVTISSKHSNYQHLVVAVISNSKVVPTVFLDQQQQLTIFIDDHLKIRL